MSAPSRVATLVLLAALLLAFVPLRNGIAIAPCMPKRPAMIVLHLHSPIGALPENKIKLFPPRCLSAPRGQTLRS